MTTSVFPSSLAVFRFAMMSVMDWAVPFLFSCRCHCQIQLIFALVLWFILELGCSFELWAAGHVRGVFTDILKLPPTKNLRAMMKRWLCWFLR